MAGGKGGGAWKVAYADFVTAMMAFFMVMWIVGQNKEVKEEIASYFQDPFDSLGHPPGIMGEKAHGPSASTSGRHLPRGDGQGPNKSGKEMQPHIRGVPLPRTSIGVEVSFADDSAELDADARAALEELAPYLVGKPQIVEVRGHASRKPLPMGSPYRDAWDLSYARCLAVRKRLEELHVEPERLRLCQSSPFEPVVNAGKAPSAATRSRVEVYLLNESVRTTFVPPPDAHAAGGHDAHGHDAHGADPHGHDAHGRDAHDAAAHSEADGHDKVHAVEPHDAPAHKAPSAAHDDHASEGKQADAHGEKKTHPPHDDHPAEAKHEAH